MPGVTGVATCPMGAGGTGGQPPLAAGVRPSPAHSDSGQTTVCRVISVCWRYAEGRNHADDDDPLRGQFDQELRH